MSLEHVTLLYTTSKFHKKFSAWNLMKLAPLDSLCSSFSINVFCKKKLTIKLRINNLENTCNNHKTIVRALRGYLELLEMNLKYIDFEKKVSHIHLKNLYYRF